MPKIPVATMFFCKNRCCSALMLFVGVLAIVPSLGREARRAQLGNERDASARDGASEGGGGGGETVDDAAVSVASAVAEAAASRGSTSRAGTSRTLFRSCEAAGPCLNGGFCINETEFGGFRCACELGYSGPNCETAESAKFPRFFGRSYIALPAPSELYERINVTIEFWPENANGLLFYVGRNPDASSDFMSLTLRNGTAELRFDCGSGMAILKAQGQIKADDWNTVVFGRQDADGYIWMNEGDTVRGQSPGPNTFLSTRTPILVGAVPNEAAVLRVGMSLGFEGCIRKMTANGRTLDMRRKAAVGDAIYGLDIEDCAAGVCQAMECKNGGYCVVQSPSDAMCLCPLGTIGPLCETFMPVSMPAFNGTGYLRFAGLRSDVPYQTSIEILFKASYPSGLILYSGTTGDRLGDFVSIALVDGHLDYRFDLGSGPAILRSRNRISLDEWHILVADRDGRTGQITVDGQVEARGQAPGPHTRLSATDNLYVGGHSNYDTVASLSSEVTGMHGCVQKVTINHEPLELIDGFLEGRNTIDCAHACSRSPCVHRGVCLPRGADYACQCPLGFEGHHCEAAKPVPQVPMFKGDGFLILKNGKLMEILNSESLSLRLQLKATVLDGLVLWCGQPAAPQAPLSDYLAIGLVEGNVYVSFNLGSGSTKMVYKATNFSDRQWHTVHVDRTKQEAFMQVDRGALQRAVAPGKATRLDVERALYVGGVPDADLAVAGLLGRPNQWVPGGSRGFSGCVLRLELRSRRRENFTEANLADDAADGRNVLTCG